MNMRYTAWLIEKPQQEAGTSPEWYSFGGIGHTVWGTNAMTATQFVRKSDAEAAIDALRCHRPDQLTTYANRQVLATEHIFDSGDDEIAILVNGERFAGDGLSLTYEGIVEMAGLRPGVTVIWRHSDGASGTLLPGRAMVARDGLVFTACRTDNA
jgi:hypothetical protein